MGLGGVEMGVYRGFVDITVLADASHRIDMPSGAAVGVPEMPFRVAQGFVRSRLSR